MGLTLLERPRLASGVGLGFVMRVLANSLGMPLTLFAVVPETK